MAKDREEVVVKKINPYPIRATFMLDSQHKPMLILKLEPRGCIAEIGERELKVRDSGTINFNLPASDTAISVPVQVVKTYSRMRPPSKVPNPGQSKTQYLIEVHFLSLPDVKKTAIKNFMAKIGQR